MHREMIATFERNIQNISPGRVGHQETLANLCPNLTGGGLPPCRRKSAAGYFLDPHAELDWFYSMPSYRQ